MSASFPLEGEKSFGEKVFSSDWPCGAIVAGVEQSFVSMT
jgi:hypothetical protein